MTEYIFRFAKSLVATHGSREPIELCRLLGISVVFADLPDTINGFYMERNGKQAVVLNQKLDTVKRDFCAAHELGHALLHSGINSYFITESTHLSLGKYEREADLFAAALLLDSDRILEAPSTEQLSLSTGLPQHTIDSFLKHYCQTSA